jgi:hypothetical protein
MIALGALVGTMQSCSSIRLVATEGCLAARVLRLTGLPFSGLRGNESVAEAGTAGSAPR